MTMTLEKALEILRANRAMLQERGVLHAAVFGSVARGEARDDSDVDILVDLEREKPSGIYEYVRLQSDIAALIGRKIDLVERNAVKPHMQGALKDAVNAF
ncbi:MAG TPA: nucleotidyltransferase domain-containing protein [Rhizomicrobium sp.]